MEDALMVGLHLRKSLEYAGYAVIDMVTNGPAAIDCAFSQQPDLILMDIMLEGEMDGIETVEVIRKQMDVPIIYLSALSDMETIRRAKITDPFGYIMKPFNERELHTNIEMALHKAKMDAQLRASEAKFYSVVRSIPTFLLTLTPDYKINFANPQVLGLLQVRQEEVQGKPIQEVIKPVTVGDHRFVPKDWWKYGEKRNLFSEPFELVGVPNPYVFGDLRLDSLNPEEASSGGYLISFKDITAQHQNEVLEKRMEKENLANLIEGQELERTRVARDLHDSLGQMLSGIKLYVETNLEFEDAEQKVLTLKGMLNEAIQETLRISHNIIPIHLQELSLRDCLAGLIRSMQNAYDGTLSFEAMGPLAMVSINQKIGVYRIVQEAISNAMKYAKAQNINVQLVFENESLSLSIEDDGTGFDVQAMNYDHSRPHHGLKNMQDRAHIMKGEFTIESSESLGTFIHLIAPVSYEHSDSR